MGRQFDFETILKSENEEEVQYFFEAIEKATQDYAAGKPGSVLAQIYLSTDKEALRIVGVYVEPEIAENIQKLLSGGPQP